MQISEYHKKLLPSLTQLINQEIAAVPPGFLLTDAQVAHAITRAGALWHLHYPENRDLSTAETVCILEHGEVVAAAQWLIPKGEKGVYSLLWLVAHPDHPIALRTLLHLIDKQVDNNGCEGIGLARCSFGVGWFGIPATWTHVTDALLEAGYKRAQRWLIMQGETSIYSEIALPPDDMQLYWNMNKPALEWTLSAYRGETSAGECQVWGVPPHLEECPGAGEWASVESLSVESKNRRQSLGKRLIAEQMRFHARRGVQHFITWTERDNRSARKLNEGMGFVYGLELVVMEKVRERQWSASPLLL